MQQQGNHLKELIMHQAARLDEIDASIVSQGEQFNAKFAKQDETLETIVSMLGKIMSDKSISRNDTISNNDTAARMMKPEEEFNNAEMIKIDELIIDSIKFETMVEYCQENFPDLLEVRY
jgi:uncharacterized protein (UPF0147 family)